MDVSFNFLTLYILYISCVLFLAFWSPFLWCLQRSIARRVGLPPTTTGTTNTAVASSSSSADSSHIRSHRMEDLFQNSFVVVIAGEYNAGKSTVINALMGSKLLKTGALPTTDCITIVSSAPSSTSSTTTTPITATSANSDPVQMTEHHPTNTSSMGDVIYHPVSTLPLLQDMTIVDTPGTNAVLTDHTAMTMRILPSADLIIFITSADRPFPESERSLLESIAVLYRKSIIVVINKMDILDITGGDHGNTEKRRVVQYVTEHASALLGAQPIVIPISARDALAAKFTGRVDNHDPKDATGTTNHLHIAFSNNESVWKRSNFESLERFLQETLTTETKIKSKLSSPIGVAEGVLDQCKHRLLSEQKEFATDIATLNLINSQFNAWKKELASDMQNMNQEIQSTLIHEGQRGIVLFQRMNWKDLCFSCLFDAATLRSEWEKTKAPLTIRQQTDGVDTAPSSSKAVISVMVSEMANSVALISRAQGQAMIEYLGKRPAMKNQSLLGSVATASQYEETRRNLHHNLMAVVHKHMDMNEVVIQESFLNRLQTIVYCNMALNVGSICVATASLTQVVDALTGFATCTTMCVGSALTWHFGCQNVVDRYSLLWTSCSKRLDDDVKSICSKETDRVSRRIMDGITPYTLFVEAEQERLQQLTDQCEGLTATARQLRNRISDIG